MADRHLNIFYTYNIDNELIENNLTRAFIVTLRILSDQVRDSFLRFLLEDIWRTTSDSIELPTFGDSEFFLQGYMSKNQARNSPYSYIVAIAGGRYEQVEAEVNSYVNSIPDAWIYSEKTGYCFLIEAKVGNNPFDDNQLYSHAKEWLGFLTPEQIRKHILTITWVDVLQAIDRVRLSAEAAELPLNQQERLILDDLEEYLGFFDYKVFGGFDFEKLKTAPEFKLVGTKISHSTIDLPAYSCLNTPPQFQLNVDS